MTRNSEKSELDSHSSLRILNSALLVYVGVPDNRRSGGWKDLPSGLLEKIAGGREDLKAMQGVCPEWKEAFEASVSKINMWKLSEAWGDALPSQARLSERYPRLRRYVGLERVWIFRVYKH